MASALRIAAVGERRRVPRSAPGVFGLSTTGRLRPGAEVTIVDLSAAGALVEGRCRLRPGATLVLSCSSPEGGRSVACRVIRCQVSSLHGAAGLSYRAALAFDDPLTMDTESRDVG